MDQVRRGMLFCIEGDNVNLRFKYKGYDDPKWHMLEGQICNNRFDKSKRDEFAAGIARDIDQLNVLRRASFYEI